MLHELRDERSCTESLSKRDYLSFFHFLRIVLNNEVYLGWKLQTFPLFCKCENLNIWQWMKSPFPRNCTNLNMQTWMHFQTYNFIICWSCLIGTLTLLLEELLLSSVAYYFVTNKNCITKSWFKCCYKLTGLELIYSELLQLIPDNKTTLVLNLIRASKNVSLDAE